MPLKKNADWVGGKKKKLGGEDVFMKKVVQRLMGEQKRELRFEGREGVGLEKVLTGESGNNPEIWCKLGRKVSGGKKMGVSAKWCAGGRREKGTKKTTEEWKEKKEEVRRKKIQIKITCGGCIAPLKQRGTKREKRG